MAVRIPAPSQNVLAVIEQKEQLGIGPVLRAGKILLRLGQRIDQSDCVVRADDPAVESSRNETISQAKKPVERFFLAAGELGPIHLLLHRASALSHSWT